jgi:hypothetical protein
VANLHQMGRLLNKTHSFKAHEIRTHSTIQIIQQCLDNAYIGVSSVLVYFSCAGEVGIMKCLITQNYYLKFTDCI